MKRLAILFSFLLCVQAQAQYQNWTIPQKVKDSTTNAYKFIRAETNNDSLKAWYQRDVAGDRFALRQIVRSIGRNNETDIYSSIEAWSKGLDTAKSWVRAQADGNVNIGTNLIVKNGLSVGDVSGDPGYLILFNGSWGGQIVATALTGQRIFSLPNVSGVLATTNGDQQLSKVSSVIADSTLRVGIAESVTGSIDFFNASDIHGGQLYVPTITANRSWFLPDSSGTLLTTGNLSQITTIGTLTSNINLNGHAITNNGTTPGLSIDNSGNVTASANLTVNGTGINYFHRSDFSVTAGLVPFASTAGGGGRWAFGQNVGNSGTDDTFGFYSYTLGGAAPVLQLSSTGAATFAGNVISTGTLTVNGTTGLHVAHSGSATAYTDIYTNSYGNLIVNANAGTVNLLVGGVNTFYGNASSYTATGGLFAGGVAQDYKHGFGGGRTIFSSNSSLYSVGLRYDDANGNAQGWLGASNSATPDIIVSNTNGTEIVRFGHNLATTLAGNVTVTTPALGDLTGMLRIGSGNAGSSKGILRFERGGGVTWDIYQDGATDDALRFVFNGGTAALKLSYTGAATFAGNVTVNGGVVSISKVSTAAVYQGWTNSGGTAYIGVDDNAGTTLNTGGLPYALVIRSVASDVTGGIQFVTGTAITPKVTITQAGSVLIGTTTDHAGEKLQVGGTAYFAGNILTRTGTATAGTSPIKIPSGVVLSTPEAGAIESDGTHLYWTTNGGVRDTLDLGGLTPGMVGSVGGWTRTNKVYLTQSGDYIHVRVSASDTTWTTNFNNYGTARFGGVVQFDDVVSAKTELKIGTASTTTGALRFYDGASANNILIEPTTLTGSRTIAIPNASGTFGLIDGAQDYTNVRTMFATGRSHGGSLWADSMLVVGSNSLAGYISFPTPSGYQSIIQPGTLTGSIKTLTTPNVTGTIATVNGGQSFSHIASVKIDTSIVLGMAQSCAGYLSLLNASTVFSTNLVASSASATRTIYLPNANGTVALAATTLAGYGITDASPLAGSSSLVTTGPLTSGSINWSGGITTTVGITGATLAGLTGLTAGQPSTTTGTVRWYMAANALYTDIIATTASTSKTIYWPNASGTVALTSDFAGASVNYASTAGFASDAASAGAVAWANVTGKPSFGSLATLSSVNNGNWSGTQLSVGNGGTGQTSLTENQFVIGNGSSGVAQLGGGGTGVDVVIFVNNIPGAYRGASGSFTTVDGKTVKVISGLITAITP